MKRLLFLLVMQSASLALAMLDVSLWVPHWLVDCFEAVRDWAWMKIQNMDEHKSEEEDDDAY